MTSHCTRWKVDEEEIRSKSMIQQKRSYCLYHDSVSGCHVIKLFCQCMCVCA